MVCLFACLFWASSIAIARGDSSSIAIARGDSRCKETSKTSTLDFKEVYKELVNQNEIPVTMTAAKEDLNN